MDLDIDIHIHIDINIPIDLHIIIIINVNIDIGIDIAIDISIDIIALLSRATAILLSAATYATPALSVPAAQALKCFCSWWSWLWASTFQVDKPIVITICVANKEQPIGNRQGNINAL